MTGGNDFKFPALVCGVFPVARNLGGIPKSAA